MKKIMLGIFALALAAGARAQSGTVLVGGNVNFSSSTVKDSSGDSENFSSFEFSPTIGYQFNDNWTVGLVGTVGTSKNYFPGDIYPGSDDWGIESPGYWSDVKTTKLAAGPFIRYTQPLSDVFSVFGQLQGQYQHFSARDNGQEIDDLKANGFNVGFYPAVFINVRNGFGLNFNIGGISYNSMKTKENETRFSRFNADFGKSFTAGITKNF